jgi:hypothetical protein
MSIGYIHIRPGVTYTKEAGLQGEPEPKGGLTFAYEVIGTGDSVKYAVAQCSWRESYNRKVGRTIASGRLFAGKYTLAPILGDETAPEAILKAEGMVGE